MKGAGNVLEYEEYKRRVADMGANHNAANKTIEDNTISGKSDADVIHTVVESVEFAHAVEHVVSDSLYKSGFGEKIEKLGDDTNTKIEKLGDDTSKRFEKLESNTAEMIEKLRNDTAKKFGDLDDKLDRFELSIGSKITDAVENAWNKKFKFIKIGGVASIALAILAFVLSLVSYNNNITDIKVSLAVLTEKVGSIDSLRTEVSTLNDRVSALDDRVSALNDRLLLVEAKSDITPIAADDSEAELFSAVANNIPEVTSAVASNASIGKDRSGNIYKASDVAGKPVLLTYTENDLEVYFYGQLNKAYCWDGFCITNAYYSDGKLFSICEYNFKDGRCISYESLYETGDRTRWIYADREYHEGKNFGSSTAYEFTNDIEKEFTVDTVELSDIKRIKDTLARDDKQLLSYYCGETSEGYYNDESGGAFLIQYLDEKVRVLQVGKFVNGNLEGVNSENGDNWEIVWNGVNAYNYYKGGFKYGEKVGDKFTEMNITQERIDELISGVEFDFTGLWLND